ncbi:MAG: GH25 family lysozyme [Liquorilactobacillus sp.]|uniref:GH25 family lysozyme n=1 Tax=Liquorilactobacillus TaxID=2767888 RepID=UPI0039ED634C
MNYKVILYQNGNDLTGILIHSSISELPKMQSTQTAVLTQSLNAVDTFVFSIGYENPGYNLVTPMRSLVKVYDGKDLIFYGRIIKQNPVMDSSGLLYQTFTANSVEDFLHDSVQIQQTVSSCTIKQYLQAIIAQHNSQVESYKNIILGAVDVSGSVVTRYLDYEDTFDSITNRLINVYGGYITVEFNNGHSTLNYVNSVGEKSLTPLRLGFNMKSASKVIDPTSVVTRLIPTGDDISTDDDSSSTTDSSLTTDEQVVTPKTVLSNPNYVQDSDLESEFGVHYGTENFSGVTDAATLLTQAKAWIAKQSTATESWEIEASNLHLIDKAVDDFKVGNQYQFVNDYVAPTEWLQVSEVDLDLVAPTNSTIKIGDTSLTLSVYLSNKAKSEQNLQKKLSYLTQLSNAHVNTINKQVKVTSDLSDNYTALSATVQNIIDNNDVWVSGNKFIDTSSNNGAMSVSDFTTLYATGVKGIMVKATEGTTYVNSTAASHLANANSAGIKTVGAYHFLVGGSTGTAQGQAFLAEIKALGLPTSTIVACDIEDPSLSSNLSTLNSMITDFYKVLTDAGYTNTCDYASASWFGTRFTSTAKYKWIASIGVTTKPNGADAWQYTWTYNGGKLDCSYSYDKAFI